MEPLTPGSNAPSPADLLQKCWGRLIAVLRTFHQPRPQHDELIFRPVLDQEGNEIGFDVVVVRDPGIPDEDTQDYLEVPACLKSRPNR